VDSGPEKEFQGPTISHTDILMAACALQKDAIVLHADAHFDLIAEKTSLLVASGYRLFP